MTLASGFVVLRQDWRERYYEKRVADWSVFRARLLSSFLTKGGERAAREAEAKLRGEVDISHLDRTEKVCARAGAHRGKRMLERAVWNAVSEEERWEKVKEMVRSSLLWSGGGGSDERARKLADSFFEADGGGEAGMEMMGRLSDFAFSNMGGAGKVRWSADDVLLSIFEEATSEEALKRVATGMLSRLFPEAAGFPSFDLLPLPDEAERGAAFLSLSLPEILPSRCFSRVVLEGSPFLRGGDAIEHSVDGKGKLSVWNRDLRLRGEEVDGTFDGKEWEIDLRSSGGERRVGGGRFEEAVSVTTGEGMAVVSNRVSLEDSTYDMDARSVPGRSEQVEWTMLNFADREARGGEQLLRRESASLSRYPPSLLSEERKRKARREVFRRIVPKTMEEVTRNVEACRGVPILILKRRAEREGLESHVNWLGREGAMLVLDATTTCEEEERVKKMAEEEKRRVAGRVRGMGDYENRASSMSVLIQKVGESGLTDYIGMLLNQEEKLGDLSQETREAIG